ncbi:hypothetical protein E3U43_013553 [Larimichthys crocea]|uniref:Uncharacterized protein n=1 Tax=Larimichthys crocea TaxID=215358 RepID=A0ACD3RA38_LARCR|nr:hypothetical protein E3U43_013553 [Larimichthys crocea]
MRNVFPKFKFKQLDTFVSVIVIFIYNVVLDKNMECLCELSTPNCNLYMALPFLIIFVLQLTMDRKCHRRWWRCTSTCTSTDRGTPTPAMTTLKMKKWKKCTCFWIFFFHFMKAAFVASLWVVSLLIDGDWYVCCKNKYSDRHPDLACKDKESVAPEEKKMIAELKNTSWNTGMTVLIVFLILTALMSPFGWIKFCNKTCCKMTLYNKALIDEEENVLQEVLKTAAKEKLTNEVNRRREEEEWRHCFRVEEIQEAEHPPEEPNEELEEASQTVRKPQKKSRSSQLDTKETIPLQSVSQPLTQPSSSVN